ncbi:MAG: sigma-70 family RNA polymerase sigma factor [Limisphaerales bacterium]
MSLWVCNELNGTLRIFYAKPLWSPFLSEPVNEHPAPDQDVELLRRIAAQDRDAFAEFYDRHSLLMFSVASKILNNADEAQDVLQEVFVQIWEKAGRFDPKLGKASSWAAILVRNKAIDRIRASQRRTRFTEEAGVEFGIVGEGNETANEAIHGQDKAKLIQSAIVDLPAEQRRAIELAFFSGLTQNEISEKLNEPLGTIKARIRRGLLKLRDQLEGLL